MRKISIIGSGNVGGLTAARLCSLGIDEIVLIDAIKDLAYAKSLDLDDARFVFNGNYRIIGTDDMNQIANSEILIITAGIPRRPGMKREELIQKNAYIIREISRKIRQISPESIVIVVTNPLDAMTYLTIKETGLPPRHIIGMGLSLDRARLANLIAKRLNTDINGIEPCVIGNHGQGMLPLSRHTKIKGEPIDRHLTQQEIKELFQKTIGRGAEIVSLLGSGSAYFAPSAAIFELTKAIVEDEKKILPVSVYLDGEFSLTDICIGLPCCIGKDGIERVIDLGLNDEEFNRFLESVKLVKKQLSITKQLLTQNN